MLQPNKNGGQYSVMHALASNRSQPSAAASPSAQLEATLWLKMIVILHQSYDYMLQSDSYVQMYACLYWSCTQYIILCSVCTSLNDHGSCFALVSCVTLELFDIATQPSHASQLRQMNA